MAYLEGVDKELGHYSVQQLLDCDEDNYGCTGGWMYQGFAYISQNGVFKWEDYIDWTGKARSTCDATPDDLAKKGHMKDIGYVESDREENHQLKLNL
mmetsp:Transcript_6509/g.10458  ORF Transcript_6509/g.10458 Transcript_6509/m.10458 type:complete len:97 (-) Transcript_6509:394-684(-)